MGEISLLILKTSGIFFLYKIKSFFRPAIISFPANNNNNIQALLDSRSQTFTLPGTYAPFGNPVNNAYTGSGAIVGSNLGTFNNNQGQVQTCDRDWITIPCVTNFKVLFLYIRYGINDILLD